MTETTTDVQRQADAWERVGEQLREKSEAYQEEVQRASRAEGAASQRVAQIEASVLPVAGHKAVDEMAAGASEAFFDVFARSWGPNLIRGIVSAPSPELVACHLLIDDDQSLAERVHASLDRLAADSAAGRLAQAREALEQAMSAKTDAEAAAAASAASLARWEAS